MPQLQSCGNIIIYLQYLSEKCTLDNTSQIEQTLDNLFRNEWGKLVAVLTKLFGTQNLQLAEDVAQDALLKAFNNWKINGIPNNPSAWVFTVARNKAIDVLRQQKRRDEFSKNIATLLHSEYSLVNTIQQMVNTNTIDDDQLQMMFVCCHPSLSTEAQVALVLKALCGLSVTEIAKAFVSKYDTIEKRLYRARQHFKENNIPFELPPPVELNSRLDNVLLAIYLLFNEGYNSTQNEDLIRKDLLDEAMRLCEIICSSNIVDNSKAHALLAIICFTASRNKARIDNNGNILLLQLQDRTQWNNKLVEKGQYHFEIATEGKEISKYHLEAGIAYEHAKATDYAATNWENILLYYNVFCKNYPSPIVALNRAIVISQLYGAAEGINAIENITQLSSLQNYYLLPATLGELYMQLKQNDKAKQYFTQAISLTTAEAEKKLLQQKLKSI